MKLKNQTDSLFIGLEWRASFNVDQQLFVKDTQNFSVQELYDACFTIPKFSSLDVFREDNQTCAKVSKSVSWLISI